MRVLLLLALAFSASGCGGDGGDADVAPPLASEPAPMPASSISPPACKTDPRICR